MLTAANDNGFAPGAVLYFAAAPAGRYSVVFAVTRDSAGKLAPGAILARYIDRDDAAAGSARLNAELGQQRAKLRSLGRVDQ